MPRTPNSPRPHACAPRGCCACSRSSTRPACASPNSSRWPPPPRGRPPFAPHRVPAPVLEHQDVGPRQGAAVRATGQLAAPAALRGVHVGHHVGGRPDRVAAGLGALQIVNGAVAFLHQAGRETGLLKLPVHVAGEHPATARLGAGPALQQHKALVRRGVAVQLQAVPVKAPGQARVALEIFSAGRIGKAHAGMAQRRVGAPESRVAAEIRQAGIHPHARAGAHDQRIGLANQVGSLSDGGIQIGHWRLHEAVFLQPHCVQGGDKTRRIRSKVTTSRARRISSHAMTQCPP